MFYNVMRQAHRDKLYVNDVFGNQYYVLQARAGRGRQHCDRIFAVGDYVADELRFLAPEFETADIDMVYNGIPAYEISAAAEAWPPATSSSAYCENLLGFRPDYVFTHVTRLVRSKGLWRDLLVLEELEKGLRSQGKTAVLPAPVDRSVRAGGAVTSTTWKRTTAGRSPIARAGPTSPAAKPEFYTAIQEFNARSRNVKVIFINQFGFDQQSCGMRMPEDMEFMDIRKGADVEFGQSIYEPFGIAQLEPLTFGGICVRHQRLRLRRLRPRRDRRARTSAT